MNESLQSLLGLSPWTEFIDLNNTKPALSSRVRVWFVSQQKGLCEYGEPHSQIRRIFAQHYHVCLTQCVKLYGAKGGSSGELEPSRHRGTMGRVLPDDNTIDREVPH